MTVPKIDATQAAQEAARGLGFSLDEETGQQTDQTASGQETATQEQESEETQTGEETETEETGTSETEGEEESTIPIQRFNEVYREKKELERILSTLVQANERLLAHQPPASQMRQQVPELPDFDSMTPNEQMRYVMSVLPQYVKQAVAETVGPTLESTRRTQAEAAVNATAAKYPDFWKYADAMADIGDKHPSLGPEELYVLATRNTAGLKKVVDNKVTQLRRKQGAKVETRSSLKPIVQEKTTFKNVKEAAIAQAKKLGMKFEGE